jgi:hypothetical protein
MEIFHLYDDEERFQLTGDLEMHFMELPKLVSKINGVMDLADFQTPREIRFQRAFF